MQKASSITRAVENISSFPETTVSNKYIKNSCYQRVNILLSTYANLVNPQFKGWYAKRFNQLEDCTIHAFAEQAAQSDRPAKYFSWLLKNGQPTRQAVA